MQPCLPWVQPWPCLTLTTTWGSASTSTPRSRPWVSTITRRQHGDVHVYSHTSACFHSHTDITESEEPQQVNAAQRSVLPATVQSKQTSITTMKRPARPHADERAGKGSGEASAPIRIMDSHPAMLDHDSCSSAALGLPQPQYNRITASVM